MRIVLFLKCVDNRPAYVQLQDAIFKLFFILYVFWTDVFELAIV